MLVEIWFGGNVEYSIEAKRIDVGCDGTFVKITDYNGVAYETSPHNVVIISQPKKGGAE
jgi:hypothetical protein